MMSVSSLSTKTIALSLLSGMRTASMAGDADQTSPVTGGGAGIAGAPGMTGFAPHLTPATAEALFAILDQSQAARGPRDPSKVLSSPDVMGALVRAGESFARAEPGFSSGDALIDGVKSLQFSIESTDLTAAEIDSLGGVGETYVRRETPQLEQSVFEKVVLHALSNDEDFMSPAEDMLPAVGGFAEAYARGEVKVYRAVDIPELGSQTVGYSIYRDGYLKGGTMLSEPTNKEYIRSIEATGLKTGLGSLWGQDYFITWPDPAAKTA